MNELIEFFRDFPGVGPRQAKRFAHFLVNRPESYVNKLSQAMIETKKSVANCSSCFRIFTGKGLCGICQDKNREKVLMIVSRDSDLDNIEKSGSFNGYYFVLGGNIAILEKDPEDRVRIRQLLNRIEKESFKEIIISTDTTTEGENTSDYVKSKIKELNNDIKIYELGRGMSSNAEIEYADSFTIKKAIEGKNLL